MKKKRFAIQSSQDVVWVPKQSCLHKICHKNNLVLFYTFSKLISRKRKHCFVFFFYKTVSWGDGDKMIHQYECRMCAQSPDAECWDRWAAVVALLIMEGQEIIRGGCKKKKEFWAPTGYRKHQLLTLSPLLPEVPCGPGRPLSPFSPCSPGGPIRPISPGWPCGMKTKMQRKHK